MIELQQCVYRGVVKGERFPCAITDKVGAKKIVSSDGLVSAEICAICPYRQEAEQLAPIGIMQATAPAFTSPLPRPPGINDLSRDCLWLGKALERKDERGYDCNCRSKWLHACEKHGQCQLLGSRPVKQCASCPDYEADAPRATPA